MNSQFAIAVHALTALAVSEGQRVTSEQIAESVNTNASFIRRVLKNLREAGMVTSQPGVNGGLTLKRRANEVTLRMVYEATERPGLFPLHTNTNPTCPVGSNIKPVLTRRFDEAERTLLASLSNTTIADVAKDVLERNQAANVS